MSDLLTERAKYEKWLAELEAKRGSTPAKAFERVHKDYTTRLDRVLEKLRAHQATLEQHAAELEEKLERLAESEEEAAESLAEAELRAQVGELTQSEWDAVSKKAEKELSKIKQDKAVTESDLERLRALMAGTPETAEKAADATPEPPETPEKPAGMDELEFLKSVVGTTPPGSSTPPKADRKVGTADKSAPPPAAPAAPKPETPTPRSQPVQRPAADRPAAAAEAEVKPVESLVEKQQESAPLIGKAAETPLSENVPDAQTIEIKPAGNSVAQTKTLKCGECSALNYPSEWYCERCGAELTNV